MLETPPDFFYLECIYLFNFYEYSIPLEINKFPFFPDLLSLKIKNNKRLKKKLFRDNGN